MSHSFSLKSALFIIKSSAPRQFIIKVDCFNRGPSCICTGSGELRKVNRINNSQCLTRCDANSSTKVHTLAKNTEMKYPLGHLPY